MNLERKMENDCEIVGHLMGTVGNRILPFLYELNISGLYILFCIIDPTN